MKRHLKKYYLLAALLISMGNVYTMEQTVEPTKKEAEQKITFEPPTLIKQIIKAVATNIYQIVKEQTIIDQIVDLHEESKDEEIQPILNQLSPELQNGIKNYLQGTTTKKKILLHLDKAFELLSTLPWEMRHAIIGYILEQVPHTPIWANKNHKIPAKVMAETTELPAENQFLQYVIIRLIDSTDVVPHLKTRHEIKNEFIKLLFKHQEAFYEEPILSHFAHLASTSTSKLALELLKIFLPIATKQDAFDALYYNLLYLAILNPKGSNYEKDRKSLLNTLRILVEVGASPFISDEQNKSILTYAEEWLNQDTITVQLKERTGTWPVQKETTEQALAILKQKSISP